MNEEEHEFLAEATNDDKPVNLVPPIQELKHPAPVGTIDDRAK